MSVTRCLIKQGTKLLVHEERTVSPTTDVDHKIIWKNRRKKHNYVRFWSSEKMPFTPFFKAEIFSVVVKVKVLSGCLKCKLDWVLWELLFFFFLNALIKMGSRSFRSLELHQDELYAVLKQVLSWFVARETSSVFSSAWRWVGHDWRFIFGARSSFSMIVMIFQPQLFLIHSFCFHGVLVGRQLLA